MGECARVKTMRANYLIGTTNFVKKIFAACSLKSVKLGLVSGELRRVGAGVEKENM